MYEELTGRIEFVTNRHDDKRVHETVCVPVPADSVTAGVGRTQEWGGPLEEIKAGDVIWCPPQVKHWHGASPTTAMTHIAITGTLNGQNVEWMEKVTDEQYSGK